MAAAGVWGGGEYDLPLEEVDAVLASFSGDPAAVFAPLLAPDAEAGASRELLAAGEGHREGLGEIEKFLMEDYEDEAAMDADGVDEFLDGVLVGDGEDDGSPKSTGERSADGAGASAGDDEEVLGADGGDDLDSKKKKRRMRNKDSAMKSRERKKLYLKDLEMKSKYLEAECCRLSYALQCCAAENMALRQSLLKDRPVGAHTAMQESAVLTETLPLVSLLWLVSIVCLFLTPGVPKRSLVAPSSHGRDLVKLARTSTNGVKMFRLTTKGDDPRSLELVRLGRRCRSTRARIRSPLLPWHAVADTAGHRAILL
ncbi:hypothetical protein PAHAL_1G071000 [Panicum hallii]|uniref:BZIP domain-containing protein n=1 Tax=Panicum hallii TaxID=206008 RepID=A0A2S3GM81_9POAL|nr:bZIP transcription factor 50-like [Panicum hallii]PAN04487.1 hypothetical protein PAHAL_1G071000 [Panicum hallii]